MRRIKRNDTVRVMKGRDRGRQGVVRQVVTDEDRVVVTGINMVKRHARARGLNQPAGIIELEAPLHVSNIRLVCPQCGKPTRVGFRLQANGAKVRYCKQCDADVD
ncbi:MAG TPA: 50S ribosomal protein L24 [Dehalococcoidia bacterium]|nr:50S ribosomal protein L24 [Dehalococcoidia bacterium]